jgi:hypothetical protein
MAGQSKSASGPRPHIATTGDVDNFHQQQHSAVAEPKEDQGGDEVEFVKTVTFAEAHETKFRTALVIVLDDPSKNSNDNAVANGKNTNDYVAAEVIGDFQSKRGRPMTPWEVLREVLLWTVITNCLGLILLCCNLLFIRTCHINLITRSTESMVLYLCCGLMQGFLMTMVSLLLHVAVRL